MVWFFGPSEYTNRYVPKAILTLYIPIHIFRGVKETNHMTQTTVLWCLDGPTV